MMNAKDKLIAEEEEYNKLMGLFDGVSSNKTVAAEGLIRIVSRMRVRMTYIWEDIVENGDFHTAGNNHHSLRPETKEYNELNTRYLSIMMKLISLLPRDSEIKASKGTTELDEFLSSVDEPEEVSEESDVKSDE